MGGVCVQFYKHFSLILNFCKIMNLKTDQLRYPRKFRHMFDIDLICTFNWILVLPEALDMSWWTSFCVSLLFGWFKTMNFPFSKTLIFWSGKVIVPLVNFLSIDCQIFLRQFLHPVQKKFRHGVIVAQQVGRKDHLVHQQKQGHHQQHTTRYLYQEQESQQFFQGVLVIKKIYCLKDWKIWEKVHEEEED